MYKHHKNETIILSVLVLSMSYFGVAGAQTTKSTTQQTTTKQTTTTTQKGKTPVLPLKIQPKATLKPRVTTQKITREEQDRRLRVTFNKLQINLANQLNTNPKVRNAVFGIIANKTRPEIVGLLNSWVSKVSTQTNQRAFDNARNQFSFGALPTARVGLTSAQGKLAQFGNEGISRLTGIEKSAVIGGLLGIMNGTLTGHASIISGSQSGSTLISSISGLVSGGGQQQPGGGGQAGQGGQVYSTPRSSYFAEGGEGGEPGGGDAGGGDTGGGDTTTGGGTTSGGGTTGGGTSGGGEVGGGGDLPECISCPTGGDGDSGGDSGNPATRATVAAIVGTILGDPLDTGGEPDTNLGFPPSPPGPGQGGGSEPRGGEVSIYFTPEGERIKIFTLQPVIVDPGSGGGSVERRQESPDSGGSVRPATQLPSVTYPKTQQGTVRPEQYRGSETPEGGGTGGPPVQVRPERQEPACVGEDCI